MGDENPILPVRIEFKSGLTDQIFVSQYFKELVEIFIEYVYCSKLLREKK